MNIVTAAIPYDKRFSFVKTSSMNELAELTELKRKYFQLSITFFSELDNGRSLDELSNLKAQINSILIKIHDLDKKLNISHSQHIP